MNCRPGDLAIVVRSRIASNLGKIVHVVGRFENGDSHIISLDTEDVIWLCRTEGSDLRWSGALGIETIRDDEGPIPDSCLRALRPGTESAPAVHRSDAPVVA